MKRFWSSAAAAEAPGGFSILLDGRPMRLPGGTTLIVPQPGLARALAEEWSHAGGGRGGEVSLDALGLTRLAATAAQRIAPDPLPTADAIAEYGASDLICYRAATPVELAARQHAGWDPWVAWAQHALGASLQVATGVMPVRQSEAALTALRRATRGHDAWELAALGVLVPALGSLVLGLAVTAGALPAAEAHELATLDERYEEEGWGADAEATARRDRLRADVMLAERFLRLARDEG